ncbi:TonB-dependent receptor [Neptunitalea lumnitzerae]|uniref:Ferrichrome-iron receptor n=1 Tax=Neptunitalea lumnitzerae TaxID=2965509 RepID=A0ABQ5MGV8_9FLAO|nr:TonB-dependent receptor [Neptunitalea sp. Y10]GLB48260.1 ferrichrome-iron receptor [Neptunitalea sp. Y10]
MKSLVAFALLFTALISNAQTSVITGKVTDTNGAPIPYANVYIQNTKNGNAANAEGLFTLSQVPYGTHNLLISAVGFKTTTLHLVVNQATQNNVNVQLNADTELDDVEVFGDRYKHPDKIEALTRLPLEPYEQIQSISVISEKLIENQGALTISEATKNVPGVYTFATYGNKRESMSSRGFRGIPILKNGVRVNSDFRGVGVLTDMQGVDNIQVLKGAAAITQGVATDLGSPGGVINIVTKTPKYQKGGSASLRVGSYGQTRATYDVYGPINKEKTLAFRIDGALERADNFRHGVSSERFYINPSLEWRVDNTTTITAEMDYFDDSRTPDLGTVNLAPNDVNAIYDLPHDQFLGFKNDKSITQNTSYSLRFNKIISEKLTLKGAFFKSSLNLDDKGASLGGAITENDETFYNIRSRGYSVSSRNDDNSVLQFDLIGDDVYTGSIKHTFQVGFDYRTTKFSTTNQSIRTLDTINVFTGISNVLPEVSLPDADPTGARSRSTGFVGQDVITWNDWVKTFLGIRYSTTQTIAETETTSSDAFNPLVGLVLSPIKNVNVFASYTNSSYPRTATRLDVNGNELGNERFDQLEAGIKTNWLDSRLRFNLTLFKINNKNINLPVYDENWNPTGYYQQGGNDQRQGVEVELTGRILENLEVVTGYSYIDAQYKEHTSYVYGSAPLNTPKHTFNAYANYSFKGSLDGLSLGAGAYYTGERPINDWATAVTHDGIVPNQKPFYVEAYTLVNLQAGYTINEHWNVRLLANNIFNTIGYNAYRTRFINQTDPRTFAAVLNYNF